MPWPKIRAKEIEDENAGHDNVFFIESTRSIITGTRGNSQFLVNPGGFDPRRHWARKLRFAAGIHAKLRGNSRMFLAGRVKNSPVP
jgi:hypothetical protein